VGGLSDERVSPSHGPQAVFLPDPTLPACGAIGVYDVGGEPAGAEAAASLGLPPGSSRLVRLARPGPDGRPRVAATPVTAVPLGDAVPALLRPLPPDASPSVQVWAAASRVARDLVAEGRVLPVLAREDGRVLARWSVDVGDPVVADALARLSAALPTAGAALAIDGPAGGAPAPGDDSDGGGGEERAEGVRERGEVARDRGDGAGDRVWRAGALVLAFLDAVADLAVRAGGDPPRAGRPRARLLPWTARWAEALVDPADPEVPLRDDADELVAGVDAWRTGTTVAEASGTAELDLTEPDDADAPWPLTFGVRADDGRLVPAADVWATAHGVAEGPTALQQTLLRDLGRAARIFPPLEPALRAAAPERLDLDITEAWALLTDGARRLADAGLVVVLPPALATSDLSLRLRVGVEDERGGSGEVGGASGSGGTEGPDDPRDHADPLEELAPRAPGGLGGTSSGLFAGLLTGFRWEVALGGETLTEEEFAAIVAAKAPLVRVRDRWVRVDPQRVRRLGELPEPGELPLADALALGLAGSERAGADLLPGLGDAKDEVVDVVLAGRVEAYVDRLREVSERPPVPVTPDGFTGELRPYQSRGVAWLAGMGDLGLGAVLADDMGLGKTVQFAAHVLGLQPAEQPTLVVCPTSVVGNWERELGRFAPSLAVTRHHGAERSRDLSGVRGVVLTTYGTLRRDVDVLAAVEWDVVALDEAQQVKNPSTAAARAVRRLRARQRVALTGTPLENRLGELWALLDATNPGLLGSRARFGRRFVTPIEQHRDAEVARRLRRLVAPFILRREKGDPTVVADLPDKLERTVACALTPEQAALYQAAVDRVLGDGELRGASAIERRGRILALLTALKQVCNHPAQYLGERRDVRPHTRPPALTGRSGKLAAAREIVAEAVATGAQLLCFTQYVEMGHLLVRQFSEDLGCDVPFLHGGVPAARRDAIVATFQGEEPALAAAGVETPPPVLVVSLRAGGTGLNLTAATHVLHYDRWWNPAVEDQATDRAHRIGQTETVTVHKLVTAGTVEERVADLLDRKRELAETVVGAGETWVTELGEAELGDLVALSADAPITDIDDEDLVAFGPGASVLEEAAS